ncbi:MAG: KH domain-containing protein [Patescibacteria group bacterium]
MQEKDAQFLDFVVKSLVDNPSAVVIGRTVDEMGVLLTLAVDPADMGKVIGRQGNTAKAIRTMLRVVGMKNNARVNLKINEPEGSTRMDPRDNMSAQAPASSAMKTVDEAMEDLNI